MSTDIRRIKDFGIKEWKKLFGKGTYADPYIEAVALTGDSVVDSNEGEAVRTTDASQEQLLSDIVEELKIMNIHLALMNDKIITKTDI